MNRQAISIPIPDGKLSGWLHLPPRHTPLRDTVAVICSPLGFEYTHSHRSIRHLADRLAARGIPALRFDYHGVGDSPGSDLDPARLARWQEDIKAALKFATQSSGCARVGLIGLRLGAALAAQVTAQQPVDYLVLWSPVLSGRRYVREMKAVAAASAQASELGAGLIDAAGFLMTSQTADSLSQLDLLKQEFGIKEEAFILYRDDLERDITLATKLKKDGIRTEEAEFPGYLQMMAEPQFTELPEAAFASITHWLFSRSAEYGADRSPPNLESAEPTRFTFGERSLPLVERPCTFGRNDELFGVLCRPERSEKNDLPVVVLLNSGSVHHVGPNRLYTTLSRSLALDGYVSFRMDLHGLGDSAPSPDQRENHPYPDTAVSDTEQALLFLKKELGDRRFILMGLCSGAHAAFHASVELQDLPIVEAVLINPLTYRWVEGMSLETNSNARHFQEVAYYKQTMRDPLKWLKLIRGKVKVGRLAQVMLDQSRRFSRSVFHASGRSLLSQNLLRLFGQGRPLTLFVARTDPGYDLLVAEAGSLVRKARKSGRLEVHSIENADHTFSALGPRNELIARLRAHLGARPH